MISKIFILCFSTYSMSDAEKINEKLDEVKEAIENIDIPDVSNLGLLLNESLTGQVSRLDKRLADINNSLVTIAHEIRQLQFVLKK